MRRRTARGFEAATVACSLLALAALVVPVSPRADATAFEGDRVGGGPGTALPPEAWDRDPYWRIVQDDVFSPTRQGPDPGAEPWTLPQPPTAVSAPPTAAPAPAGPPQYRLSGIVQGPDGFAALIDADPRVPGAEIYRIGDRVGPFRLTEASDSTVVLTGPAGTRVLRLRRVPGRTP